MFYCVHYVNFIIMLVCTNKTVLWILAVTCSFKKSFLTTTLLGPYCFGYMQYITLPPYSPSLLKL